MAARLPDDEDKRLAVLHHHRVLDTAPLQEFEDLVRLAAHVCGVPIAAVSLIDEQRLWFKAITGLDATEIPRDVAFCAHTILETDLLTVSDTLDDPRFADNPHVTGDPHIRFYAGMPLITEDGYALGSLCVIDRKPRTLTFDQEETLRLLARQVSSHLKAARLLAEREAYVAERESLVAEKERLTALQASAETALSESHTALEESRRFAESIAANSNSIIYVFDLDLQANVYSNRNLGEFLGLTVEQIAELGADLLPSKVHPEDLPHLLAHCAEFAHAEDGQVIECEFRAMHASGDWHWIWIRESIFKRHPDGTPHQLLGNGMDVTERKQDEEVLRYSQARLAEAQRIAQIGSWEYDLATAHISWSDELYQLFELDPAQGPPSTKELLSRFHPDDIHKQEAVIGHAVRGELPYEVDIRILKRDSTIRWAHVIAQVEHQADGQVKRLFGTVMDITERRLAEERFRVLFEYSSQPHVLANEENGIIDCNVATLKMMRCADKSELLGRYPALLAPEFQPDGRRSDEKSREMRVLAWQNGVHRFEWQRRAMDGYEFPVEVTLTPVMLDGKPALLSVWYDLTERKLAEQQLSDHAVIMKFHKEALEQANTELERLASTDGLTGLTNHRVFHERLVKEIGHSARCHTPLSLILLDVDRFKSYNDAFGHPAGDDVLKRVGELLRNTARESDVVARYGGEEFAVILPQTDSSGAAVIAERLRRTIESGPWPNRAITVSVGTCTLSAGMDSGKDLIAGADQALYRSKAEGRNKVTLSSSSDLASSHPLTSEKQSAQAPGGYLV